MHGYYKNITDMIKQNIMCHFYLFLTVHIGLRVGNQIIRNNLMMFDKQNLNN